MRDTNNPGPLSGESKVVWRTIRVDGVWVGGVNYSSLLLCPYLLTPNWLSDTNERRWPFRHDPDDPTRIHFEDPTTGVLHAIPRVSSRPVPPFKGEAP